MAILWLIVAEGVSVERIARVEALAGCFETASWSDCEIEERVRRGTRVAVLHKQLCLHLKVNYNVSSSSLLLLVVLRAFSSQCRLYLDYVRISLHRHRVRLDLRLADKFTSTTFLPG